MRIDNFICDVCTAAKTPSNGWWIVYSFEDGRLNIRPWDDAELMAGSEHICGDTCMAKLVTQHTATWRETQKELSQKEY